MYLGSPVSCDSAHRKRKSRHSVTEGGNDVRAFLALAVERHLVAADENARA
jgi:hypothetical protein